MSTSIVVGVFGDLDRWGELAWSRAIPSAQKQTVEAEVVYSTGETLAQARNQGVKMASGDLIICLDADDELDVGYVEAMEAAYGIDEQRPSLYQPSTLGVYQDGRQDAKPVLIPRKPLDTGNFLVIGTAFEKSVFESVGGFDEWPFWEDWALFIKMFQHGAIPVQVPDAIYRVHVTTTGRNNIPDPDAQRLFSEIRKTYYG